MLRKMVSHGSGRWRLSGMSGVRRMTDFPEDFMFEAVRKLDALDKRRRRWIIRFSYEWKTETYDEYSFSYFETMLRFVLGR